MNRGQIVDEIIRFGFGDLEFPRPVIEESVNMVYAEIQSGGELNFLEAGPEDISISAGSVGQVSETTLPANYSKAIALTHGAKKLKELDPRTFIQIQLTDDKPSDPSYYTVYNTDRLLVWPSPSGNIILKLWYEQQLDNLTNDSQVPQFPEKYHYLLVWGVLSKLYLAQDEDDKWQSIYEGRYIELLKVMRDDLDNNNLDVTDVIGDDYNVGAIAKMVRENGFDDYSVENIRLMANQAVQELGAVSNWGWLEAQPETLLVERGKDTIDLPEDCSKPRRIMVKDSNELYPLENIKVDEFLDSYRKGGETTGSPTKYAIWGTKNNVWQARVFPTPDRDYQAEVWYIKNPKAMESITDTPPLPSKHHRIILLGVLIQCATYSTDEKLASKLEVYKAEYNELKDQLFSDDQIASFDKPFVIKEENDW